MNKKTGTRFFYLTLNFLFFIVQTGPGVLSQSYSYHPFYLTVKKEGAPKALLPIMEVNSRLTGKRGVSLPFSDYCEPIASVSSDFKNMFDAAVGLGKKRNWRYVELKGGSRFLTDSKPSENFYGHTLDLTLGLKKLETNLRNSCRRNIKRARREHVAIHISSSLETLNSFCRLNDITRKVHGLPPQPYRFFQHLQHYMISEGMGFIVLASHGKKAIAANVYLNLGGKIVYKYGASNQTGRDLRANNLVMWEAIKWGVKNGYGTLCFGRTEPDNEGLRRFKMGFNPEEHLIQYYRYDLTTDEFICGPDRINAVYKKIFAKLPLQILRLLGRALYPHVG